MGKETTPRIIETDTLILGGGVAGIAAAHELESKNHDANYLLLEAKPHLGGRVHTDEDGDDLGAFWFHEAPDAEPAYDTRNPLTRLAKALKYALVTDPGKKQIFYKGSEYSTEEYQRIVEAAYQKLEAAAEEPQDQSIQEALKPEPGSLEEAIYQVQFGGPENALDISQVSVKDYIAMADSTEGKVLPQGMGRMFQDYAAKLPQEKIRLDTEIVHIRWAKYPGGKVVMIAKDGTEYHAKNAIITLPIGVLQDKIKEPEPPYAKDYRPFFVPQLPREKEFAINDLQMGQFNKIIISLTSSEFFTKRKIEPTTHLHVYDDQNAKFYVANPLGQPKFTMLVGGTIAEKLEREGKEAATHYALEGLKSAYGEDVLSHIDRDKIKVTEWGKDPCARGAYTGSGIGKGAARHFIAKPTGNLFWAGEACKQKGWESHITGAYYSGVDAARAAYYQLYPQKAVDRR